MRDAVNLVEIITRYVPDLKKKGANYTGCCPFHDEKTGSFSVNDTKGIYKCFGCGAGGNDAVRFIMDKENWDFPSAVKYLANWYNITLVETKSNDETDDVKANRADYLKINTWAAKQYQKHLLSMQVNLIFDGTNAQTAMDHLVTDRKFTYDSLVNFQIGFAPDQYKFLTPLLIERAMFKPATDIGLVKTTNNNNFDVYRNRIMFPIHNERGEVIGFGGRILGDTKDTAKYLNSSDSLVYKKENVLYGIYQAGKSIREMGFAILVEGYTDVISFHQRGATNTVCSCGTAFTEGHAKLLKKYTSHVVLMGDPDPAGEKANLRNVDLLVRNCFKVEICQLPKGLDPDDFARSLDARETEPAADVETSEDQQEVAA